MAYLDDIHNLLPDNTMGDISAKDMRDCFDLIDNEYNNLKVEFKNNQSNYIPDFDLFYYFEYTANQNITINRPINVQIGQNGFITIIEDTIGGWNIQFDPDYIFANGAPSINLTANATNIFRFTVIKPNKILVEYVSDI